MDEVLTKAAQKENFYTAIFRFTFARFKDVRANCFCASRLRTQMHTPRHSRAHALSNKMNNNRTDGHC